MKWKRYLRRSDGVNDSVSEDMSDGMGVGVGEELDDDMSDYRIEDNLEAFTRELEFVIFCIEGLAERLNIEPQEVYSIIAQKTDIMNKYIFPAYERLHDQSKEYVVNDILEVIKERGVEV